MARVVDRLLAQLPGLQGSFRSRALSQPNVHGRIPDAYRSGVQDEVSFPHRQDFGDA